MIEMSKLKRKNAKQGKNKYAPVNRVDTDDEGEDSASDNGHTSQNTRSFNYSLYSGHAAVSTHEPDEEEVVVQDFDQIENKKRTAYPSFEQI